MERHRVLLLSLGLCLGVLGQTVSTEILGLVTDPSGAVIPGATVTVNRVATGDVRTATTNETGNYRRQRPEGHPAARHNGRCSWPPSPALIP